MKKQYEKFLEKIKSHPVILTIGIILVIFSSITQIIDFSLTSKSILRNFQKTKIEYSKINSLSADVNINYFKSILGEPAFINQNNISLGNEYVFVKKRYYVEAITDENENVIVYSVTTKDKKFNPISPDGFVELGVTTFKDLNDNDFFHRRLEVFYVLGAHDFFFTEGYYWGNPMYYQSYYYSTSHAGYVGDNFDHPGEYNFIPEYINNPDKSFMDILSSDGEDAYTSNPDLLDFLKENTNTINTFSVTAPWYSIKDFYNDSQKGFPYIFGPDINQVRMLDWKI